MSDLHNGQKIDTMTRLGRTSGLDRQEVLESLLRAGVPTEAAEASVGRVFGKTA